MPAPAAIDLSGLRLSDADMAELTRADVEAWTAELPSIYKHYEKFGDRLPPGLKSELKALERRLQADGVGANR